MRSTRNNLNENVAVRSSTLLMGLPDIQTYQFSMPPTSASVTFDENDLPYSSLYGDHYFSKNDGLAECDHVFLGGNSLPERWQNGADFTVGELGFGTGLNFLQTWATWQRTREKGQHLTFVSTEAHLMNVDSARQALSRWPQLEPHCSQLLELWDRLIDTISLDDDTTLQVVPGNADIGINRFPMVDAWFLDGFAPVKNPDMWSESLMCAVAEHTHPSGTFASYTAAGWVRRNLEAAGFVVEKRPGFGTKRHMISGVKR